MNIEEIKTKYLVDDGVSKAVNEFIHNRKQKGIKLDKNARKNVTLRAYINQANQKLGRSVIISENSDFGSPNPTFGINWAARGTVSITEAKAFVKKLQMAIDLIQKAPRSGGAKYSY